MNQRERVLATFRFQSTDQVPFDLMEGAVWTELMKYFAQEHGCPTERRYAVLSVDAMKRHANKPLLATLYSAPQRPR